VHTNANKLGIEPTCQNKYNKENPSALFWHLCSHFSIISRYVKTYKHVDDPLDTEWKMYRNTNLWMLYMMVKSVHLINYYKYIHNTRWNAIFVSSYKHMHTDGLSLACVIKHTVIIGERKNVKSLVLLH